MPGAARHNHRLSPPDHFYFQTYVMSGARAQLAGRGFSHLPTKAERIERVIVDDLAFLAAHPVRHRRNSSEAITPNPKMAGSEWMKRRRRSHRKRNRQRPAAHSRRLRR
jgi:hypothetical protein